MAKSWLLTLMFSKEPVLSWRSCRSILIYYFGEVCKNSILSTHSLYASLRRSSGDVEFSSNMDFFPVIDSILQSCRDHDTVLHSNKIKRIIHTGNNKAVFISSKMQ